MYIKKIDDLFDIKEYNKHYNHLDKKISYINKINITKRFNIFLNFEDNIYIKTEIPLKNSNYFFSTYHKSLEDTYKYLYYIITTS